LKKLPKLEELQHGSNFLICHKAKDFRSIIIPEKKSGTGEFSI